MIYRRVIPRDLFNEAKLLKCLGQLSLLLHDGKLRRWSVQFHHKDPETGFLIEQDPSGGELFCVNLTLYFKDRKIVLFSGYNSKEPYPLFTFDDEDAPLSVLDSEGDLAKEFTDWLDRLTAT